METFSAIFTVFGVLGIISIGMTLLVLLWNDWQNKGLFAKLDGKRYHKWLITISISAVVYSIGYFTSQWAQHKIAETNIIKVKELDSINTARLDSLHTVCSADSMWKYIKIADSFSLWVNKNKRPPLVTQPTAPTSPAKRIVYDTIPELTHSELNSITTSKIKYKDYKIKGKLLDDSGDSLYIVMSGWYFLEAYQDNIYLSYPYYFRDSLLKYFKPGDEIKVSCVMYDKKHGRMTSIELSKDDTTNHLFGSTDLWGPSNETESYERQFKIYERAMKKWAAYQESLNDFNLKKKIILDDICVPTHMSYTELNVYRGLQQSKLGIK